MSGWLIAAVAFTVIVVVIAVLLGRWVHYEHLAVWWWPLVGAEWRAERRGEYAEPIPAEQDDAWHELVRLGQQLDVRIEPELPVALSADEWEQLDPDTAAETLIREWHAEEAEYVPDTGQMALLDDLHVLAWDAGRQLQMLRAGVAEWRASTAGPLLAWYQVKLDQRRAA